jgi:Sec-independent protein translocase protein TatA
LVALLFMFAEKIPGFENFAGGRLKAFKDRINLQLSGNVQKLVNWVRPAPKP